MKKPVGAEFDQYIAGGLSHLKSAATRALVILQAVDSDIIRNNALLNTLPSVGEDEEESLREARISLERCLAEEEMLTQDRKAIEHQIFQTENDIEQLSAHLINVRTNISRAMTLEEINKRKEQMESLLKNLECLTDEHIEAQGFTATSKANVRHDEEKFLKKKQEILERRENIRAKISHLIAVREALVPEAGQHYGVYMELMDKTSGTAVVTMEEDLCGGCQMTIMPWLSVRVRNSDTPVQCPHCSRFLYAAPSTPKTQAKSEGSS